MRMPYSALNNHVNILALCFHILLSTALTLGGLKGVKLNFFSMFSDSSSLSNIFLFVLVNDFLINANVLISLQKRKVFWNCWCSTKLFMWPCFAFLEECLYRFFSPCRDCVHSLSFSLSYIKITVDRETPPLASSLLSVVAIQILGHQYVVLVFHQYVVGVL